MALQVLHYLGLKEKLLSRYNSCAPLSSRWDVPLSFYSRIGNGTFVSLPKGIIYRNLDVVGPMRAYHLKKVSKRYIVKCSSSLENHRSKVPQPNQLVKLALFPLPSVLFPGATIPLHIFEFKYRIMMHTLLQTDLRVGVIYTDNSIGMADVGCSGEVVKYERLVDDRFYVICKGQERFRVVNIVQTKPYMVAEVQWLEDKPLIDGQYLESLCAEVETYMMDVIKLSNKINEKPEKEIKDLRRNLSPTPFSFFVGSTIEGVPREQQALLELEDTVLRLKREREILKNKLNYLVAASALEDAFQSSSLNEN